MNIYKGDDGMTYIIYSKEDNNELNIGTLTQDYFDVINVMRPSKLSWWYRVKSNTLTGEDNELRFFVCQASNLGGIE
ncbi:hypothetical protein Tco_0189145 [Tanacetum coccineum]